MADWLGFTLFLFILFAPLAKEKILAALCILGFGLAGTLISGCLSLIIG